MAAKNWQKEFQKQYLIQQNEKPTEQNIKEFGLDLTYSELLKETDTAWIIYHNEGNSAINIVYKNNRFMESLEIT
jgi:16S rRNA U516 pseudouridylate synthase RsuA-like enzyme